MNKRIEVFSANCPCCESALRLINDLAGPGDDVTVVSMLESSGQQRAKELGVARVPAVVIDGELASCCSGAGIDLDLLRAQGVGR